MNTFFKKLQQRAQELEVGSRYILDEDSDVDSALKELRLVAQCSAVGTTSKGGVEHFYALSKRGEKFAKCSEKEFNKAIEPALNSQTATRGSYSRAIFNDIDNVLLELKI